ncbi:PAS domain S-box protein [Methanosarcina sp. T3]|uniref:PAS domain S-box protein n=1 Tax=Methanosarcina sp. T3 TaxID=3439062 RepID=UPI003F875C0A
MSESYKGLKKSKCDNIKGTSGVLQALPTEVFENPGVTSVSHENDFFVKSMLNAMVNPVCYKDRNGVYLGVNEIFARQIAGLPEEEIIGYTLLEGARKVVERFPERAFVNGQPLLEHVKEWSRDDIELLNKGGKRTYEYEGICADGVRRVFLVNKSTFSSEKGEIRGLITVLQDITVRDEVQRALQEKEEKYRIITEQTEQIVYDFDFRSNTGNLEGAVEEVTGHPVKDFQGIPPHVWIGYLHPEDLDHVNENITKIQREGGKYRQEFRFRKKDGTYFYAADRGTCLLDESGKPYKLLGVIKDITERKLAHERVQKSEERYRSFIENFKGIAFQADENFIPNFLHGALEEITGYTEEEFGSKIRWKDIIDPEYLPLIIEEENKIRKVPEVRTVEVEYRIRDKKGKTKWVHETCQKIPGREGKPEIYQGVIYDITEKKRAEETLAKVDAARKKEIHHRIKNNLQVISSLLDLQAEKFCSREFVKAPEVLEAFRESQDRMISIALIHEGLHENGETDTLNFSPYLERLVDTLFQTYRLGSARITLKKELEENIFFDMDVAVPLGLIVNELVSNSLKHAFSGRGNGEIDIKLCREKNLKHVVDLCAENRTQARRETGFILTVSDNGTGISDTVDMENSDSLGLQLVNILVEQLEGEMEVKREKGTEFTIRISIAEEA